MCPPLVAFEKCKTVIFSTVLNNDFNETDHFLSITSVIFIVLKL